jgi:large subunit ribosomal protein L35Ae
MFRLYCKGRVLGYKRSKVNQAENQSLVQIEGVKTRAGIFRLNIKKSRLNIPSADTDFYLGKRVAYVYRAKKAVKGSKIRVIWGRIARCHGNSGVVKARFRTNLPPKAMGASVRVMLYPSRV